jgi:serine/threonine protein kinase/Tol biopolymer transport system component
MSLVSGTNLGPYQIQSPLGAGGMGEVYKARDTKLDRQVAIKVLPDALARDPERLARFEREAKVLASLNHPNIAHVYGIEESASDHASGVRALVMELVPGAPIKGPLPLETAINYAKQIAEALEAAHEKGIVHRDLKPANILVTPGDVVKVLDFGLASVENREQQEVDPSNSPTVSVSPTRAGMIMGTAAYMSPEQARGKVVDKRTDIWAFGAVLYEIIVGKPLFSGETVSDIFVEVLSKEPDLGALPDHVRYVVERCLRKNPRKRWQAIGDVRIALEEGVPEQSVSAAAAPAVTSKSWLPWAIAGFLLVAALGTSLAAWRASHTASESTNLPLQRFDSDLGVDIISSVYASTFAAISPDGTRLIYTVRSPDGKPMFAMRMMDKTTGVPIPGTERGHDPFFSPDGQWLGFFAETNLKKISVNGGAPIVLAEASNPRGASWSEDGTIVAALINTSGLFRVSADGGSPPQPLTKLNAGESTHRWPQVLPGGQIAVFTSSDNLSDYENANVEAVNIKTGERKIVQGGAYFGRLTPSGHLLYVHNAIVFAEAMAGASSPVKDLGALKPQGNQFPIVDDVASQPSSGAGQFDFSQNGLFVYESGKSSPDMWSIVGWNGTTGALEFGANSAKSQLQISKPAPYFTPRFSPDGGRLALGIETKGLDIYVYDFQSDVLTRLTFTGQLSYNPVWTPDGKHIAFQTVSGNDHALMWIRSDGAGGAQELLEGKSLLVPRSFSPDGKFLAYHSGLQNNSDLWVLPLDTANPDRPKPGTPEVIVGTPANEKQPAISPDGRWVAYSSDETGIDEIYVRPFHGTSGGKWQVSSGGGNIPGWSRDGKKLFFENMDGRIMLAGYEEKGQSFAASKPRSWMDHQLVSPTGDPNFDISPDGKMIVALVRSTLPGNAAETVKATFLLNFFDELRRRTGTVTR